ncbi:MIP/aquaporin family protein [Metabacillus iocasae]|uniref:Glycerol uptake facilitator protein n=1 Tax=Priestia iocasae TaxID=2291674 RepID=A0ABS2QTI0_9BACI|nr:MIP/aquaporin family protein [Metabacillus iocasae]MBM7702752.1 glycerol uptake facilitator protein [Metabacillus iocasae]
MNAFWGEVVGTMILIVLGAGVCAGVSLKKSYAANSGWIVITMGWGLGVAMAVYAVGTISGAHLNPAVTVGLAFTGDFAWADVPMYIAAQFLGAMIGSALIYLHYLPHWKATEDPATKLGVFSTGPAIANPFANLLSETIGTFILVLGILAIGANEFTEGLNPLIVGFLIVSIGLSLGGTTGYAINPARDLGPRIAHALLPIPGKGGSNWSYAWIPVVGPILGGSLGAVFYQFAFENKVGTSLWGVIVSVLIVLGATFVLTKLKDTKLSEGYSK